jgi:aminoglycoside 3-N-acetyltransferase I
MRVWLACSSHILIEATVNEAPIGFALGYVLGRFDTARPMLFLYEIEVAAAWRQQGVGRRLVERMKAIASELHVMKMWVQTSPDNEAAQRLYHRAGAVRAKGVDLLYVWTSLPADGPPCPSQAQGTSE